MPNNAQDVKEESGRNQKDLEVAVRNVTLALGLSLVGIDDTHSLSSKPFK